MPPVRLCRFCILLLIASRYSVSSVVLGSLTDAVLDVFVRQFDLQKTEDELLQAQRDAAARAGGGQLTSQSRSSYGR